ncbi:MAG: hypothetical protein IJ781_13825 [Atopobiaceae bacterium]|nr:hypothetical protein [Atopobiaceae bacterium]
MRKTKMFEGKRHVYDTEKAEALGTRSFGYYGDPAGYEETLYKTKGGLYFFWGLGGEDSPYAADADIRPVSEEEATTWLEA